MIQKLHYKKGIIAFIIMLAMICSVEFKDFPSISYETGKQAKAEDEPIIISGQHIWLESSAQSVTAGDVIEVGLYMQDIPDIKGMSATIAVDKDVFDETNLKLIVNPTVAEQWNEVTYNSTNIDNPKLGTILLVAGMGKPANTITQKTLIATFKLKVKKSCKKTTISLSEVEASNSTYDSLLYSDCSCTISASCSNTNPGIGTGAPVSHLYTDYTYTTAVTDNSTVIYANGSTVTADNQKNNYKQAVLYTDILASYLYSTDAKGKLKTATGKVIAGITTSSTKPELVKGKIVDKEAAKIATASIKNGMITVTAKTVPGTVYLWVMDTGGMGTYTSCPITIKAAPTSMNLYAISDSNTTFDFQTTKKYTKDTIVLSDTRELHLYPSYKLNKDIQKTDDATYTAYVDSKSAEYFSVIQSPTDPYCFIVTAKGLQNNKKTTGKIIIQCNQNGKKAVFTAIAVNQ